jgi:hypothetical protein
MGGPGAVTVPEMSGTSIEVEVTLGSNSSPGSGRSGGRVGSPGTCGSGMGLGAGSRLTRCLGIDSKME